MFGGSYNRQDSEHDFKTLPKGRFLCTLDNCVIKETKGNQTPYLEMIFKVEKAVVDGAVSDEFKGQKLWHKLWFTEKAYDVTSQQLDNILVFHKIPTTEYINTFMDSAARLVFELVSKKFVVEVTGHDEYNGNKYPKTFLVEYKDVINHAVQTETKASSQTQAPTAQTPKHEPRVIEKPAALNATEEIPF